MTKKRKTKQRKYKTAKSVRKKPVPKNNRHHILYPRAAWERLGPVGIILRESFVVRMRYDQHKSLHRKIDRTLGGYVWSDKLPKKSTLNYLEKELARDYKRISRMDAIDMIEWLMDRLSYHDAHSYWLKTMLRRQRDYFLDLEKGA